MNVVSWAAVNAECVLDRINEARAPERVAPRVPGVLEIKGVIHRPNNNISAGSQISSSEFNIHQRPLRDY